MIRFILFIMLAFALDGWGACEYFSYGFAIYISGSDACRYGDSCNPATCANTQQCRAVSGGCPAVYQDRNRFYYGGSVQAPLECTSVSSGCVTASGNATRCFYFNFCSSQREADSSACVLNSSKEWVNGQCVDAVDRCAVYQQQCLQLGGVFTGHQTPTGCAASCNTCGNSANKNIMEIKARSCCNQGLAPSVDNMCYTPDIATGDGMQVSTNANLDCVDPNIDDENLNLYVEYCEDEEITSSASPGSSSSGLSSGGGGSSEEGSSGGEAGTPEQIDYYPILDSIRDTLNYIKHDVHTISTCLLTPGACAGLDNQIDINVPSDSSFIKQLNTTLGAQTDLLDSSLKNGNERLRNSIASANDTLIDSLRKFLGALSFGFSGDTLGDSLGRLHRTLEEFKAMFEAGQIDTSGLGAEWGSFLSRGDLLADSVLSSVGWADIDTMNIDSVFTRAMRGVKNIDSLADSVDDSLSVYAGRLNDSLKAKTDSIKMKIPSTLDSIADSLVVWSPFAGFDSLIYESIGVHVPNRDECPEDCQKWTINIPLIGVIGYEVDFGLCLGRASFAGISVLGFVKLLIRIIVAYICIMTVYKVLIRMI